MPLIPYLAAITKKVRVGVSVIDTPYRAPGVLAAEIGTWDHLSGGRVNVGVGTGWMPEEFEAASAGHIYERRNKHVIETIEIVQGVWTEELFEYHGEFASFPKCGFGVKPVQKRADDSNIYAINPDGSNKWAFSLGSGAVPSYSDPAIGPDGAIYFGNGGVNPFSLYKVYDLVDPATGVAPTVAWQFIDNCGIENGTTHTPTISADGSTVYFGDAAGCLHAVFTASGVEKWTNNPMLNPQLPLGYAYCAGVQLRRLVSPQCDSVGIDEFQLIWADDFEILRLLKRLGAVLGVIKPQLGDAVVFARESKGARRPGRYGIARIS